MGWTVITKLSDFPAIVKASIGDDCSPLVSIWGGEAHRNKIRKINRMGDGRLSNSGSNSSSKPEWLEQYDVIGKIGEGTYGLVFLAKIKSNRSKSIAIKKFKQSKDGDGVSPTAIREIMVKIQSSLPSFRVFMPLIATRVCFYLLRCWLEGFLFSFLGSIEWGRSFSFGRN